MNIKTTCRRVVDMFLVTTSLLLFVSPISSNADSITVSLDANLFGDLRQAETNCKNLGCGPTSLTNSLVYLQRKFPNIYDSLLIPDRNFNGMIDHAEMIRVANDIGQNYMKTCVPRCVESTTLIEDFILGKRDYIEAKARGKTAYAAEIWPARQNAANAPWRVNPPEGTHPGTQKPSFVQDSTKPTLSFIANQIAHGEDVEIFVSNDNIGHYMTVTGISYDTVTDMGTISLIDPLGAENMTRITRNILGLNANGFIRTSYQLEGANTIIYNVASESAVPEPSTVILSLSALGILTLLKLKGGRVLRHISGSN